MPIEVELVLRLLLAAFLAGAIGLEREVRDQPAGFRTHMLVSLGACLFAVISAYGWVPFAQENPNVLIRVDPTRIAAQIVTGIGFLGAGAILRSGMSVRGLTTAASLWVVAAIGAAIGLGSYIVGSATALIALLTLLLLRPLRQRLVRGMKPDHEEYVVRVGPELQLERLIADVSAAHLRIDSLRIEEEDRGEREIQLLLRVPGSQRPEDAAGVLARTPGVRNVDWSR
jgi:putative Mg2+ transporter-C (MgtC) family protein